MEQAIEELNLICSDINPYTGKYFDSTNLAEFQEVLLDFFNKLGKRLPTPSQEEKEIIREKFQEILSKHPIYKIEFESTEVPKWGSILTKEDLFY